MTEQDGGDLKRVKSSYSWPSGHIGHLSDAQKASLEQFRKLAAQRGYYTPADEHQRASHDDETLLRYLRARKWTPRDAYAQLKETEDWRKENQLDKLYETIDIHEYDAARRLYPQWIGRRDRRGIPLYVFEVGQVDPKAVSAYASGKDSHRQSTNSKLPWKMMKLFALYENLCRFVLPLCSAIPNRPNPESPISQSNNIVDLNDVSFGKLWNLRNHMSDASKLANAHYPETLDRIFVVGAPSYFSTIWKWAQGWFDPITVSKIFILTQEDMKSTLEKYVDLDNVPKKYGGNLDWKFDDLPKLEPEIVDSLQWAQSNKELPTGPIKLHYDEAGDLVITAIGSESSTPRNSIIARLKPGQDVAKLALSAGIIRNPNETPNSTSAAKKPIANGKPKTPNGTTTMNNDPNLNIGKDPHSHLPNSSRAGTYTVPYQDQANGISSPPADGRQGTSATRQEQQAGTHAEGQLAGRTETRQTVNADRPAVMDPSAVGQAPKEHNLPEPEQPQPSVVDQAKDMAGQAVEQAKDLPTTVMNAVGMGSKTEEESNEPAVQVKKDDPRIDQMAGKNVEEFLRSQNASQAQKS